MKYFIAIILLFSLWLFAGSFIVETKDTAVFGFSQILLWPKWWIKGLFNPAIKYKAVESLRLENENLKAKIFELNQKQGLAADGDFLIARIHAHYPFNDKSSFSIDLGSDDDIKKNMVVTAGPNILLGKVEEVFSSYSLVKTIFSSDQKLPVRIGERGVEALLSGGSNLKVAMIAKDKKITDGEAVFSASKDYPYGLKIGEAENIQQGLSTGVFQEADVKVPYNFRDLTEVWLRK